ncbi:MAG: peptidyl-prolyl cis-trans isomerase [Bdellovibrionota bacterium]
MRSSKRNEGKRALVFCFPILLVSLSLASCFSREDAVLDKTVLVVNAHEVSTREFAERLASKLRDFDALHAKDESSLDRAKEDIVHQFVLEFVTRDFATAQKISVTKDDVEAKARDVRSSYPDDYAFRRALADGNLSIEKWKRDLEFSVLQKKVVEAVTEKMPEPTEADLKADFDATKTQWQQPARVRLRQIVLEKEDDAKRIMDELEAGKSLAALAKEFSVAPEGSNGGDTGWLDKGTLEVFDQAFKMKEGARSKILKSPYGYHIYELIKKEPETRLNFQDAKAKIRARLMEQRSQTLFSQWLEAQVRKSSVKRNDAVLRAIKVSTRGS